MATIAVVAHERQWWTWCCMYDKDIVVATAASEKKCGANLSIYEYLSMYSTVLYVYVTLA